jgi:hypothetical protein
VDRRKKRFWNILSWIGIISMAIWVFGFMFLEDLGYEIAPEFYLVTMIPFGILVAAIVFEFNAKDSVSKNMKRGLSLLFVGAIGIVLWLYVLLSLRASGQEITSGYFLAFLLPLGIALVGLCYFIYSTYLMTKVRKERLERID